ncbi:MAG: hypothetical protein ACK59Y_10390 [Betaproteobacteria bacterium]|nr:hypothetical protein [Betaproteobacteria bacterium]
MASSLQNPPARHWHRATLALMASLLVHVIMLELSGGGGDAARPASALHAELRAAPPALEPLIEPVRQEPRIPQPLALPAKQVPAASRSAHVPSADTVHAPARAEAEGGADSRVYTARELDRFPQPLQPLPRWQGDTLRLWLTIDTRGHVVDLAVATGAFPLDPQWRERIAGVLFSPAMREERPVRARILLELRE